MPYIVYHDCKNWSILWNSYMGGVILILFKEITKENFWDCVELMVTEEQVDFVTSNAVSIAQSKVQPECIPLAVYDDKIMVGFLMYCIDEDDGEY